MATNSGINTTGNYAAGASKREIKNYCNYDYEYTPDFLCNAIQHKAEIVSNRNNGSFEACELLLDVDMYEYKYLNEEQRELIELRYLHGLELQEIANKKHTTRYSIARELARIKSDITKGMEGEYGL